jgi:hypothetical protein
MLVVLDCLFDTLFFVFNCKCDLLFLFDFLFQFLCFQGLAHLNLWLTLNEHFHFGLPLFSFLFLLFFSLDFDLLFLFSLELKVLLVDLLSVLLPHLFLPFSHLFLGLPLGLSQFLFLLFLNLHFGSKLLEFLSNFE